LMARSSDSNPTPIPIPALVRISNPMIPGQNHGNSKKETGFMRPRQTPCLEDTKYKQGVFSCLT
jgi:hypothetical protein